MASLIQAGGGQEVYGRDAREHTELARSGPKRHNTIRHGMIASLIGVAAGAAMLVYGNFGHPSAVQAESSQTIRIVAAPLDSQPQLVSGPKMDTHVMAPAEVSLAAADPTPTQIDQSPVVATPMPDPVVDQQVAEDAASTGMTTRAPTDASGLG